MCGSDLLHMCFLLIIFTKIIFVNIKMLAEHALCHQIIIFSTFFLNYVSYFLFYYFFYFLRYKPKGFFFFSTKLIFLIFYTQNFLMLLCKNGSWSSKWDLTRLSKSEVIKCWSKEEESDLSWCLLSFLFCNTFKWMCTPKVTTDHTFP